MPRTIHWMDRAGLPRYPARGAAADLPGRVPVAEKRKCAGRGIRGANLPSERAVRLFAIDRDAYRYKRDVDAPKRLHDLAARGVGQ